MTKLYTPEGYPNIHFTEEEATFLLWFLEALPSPATDATPEFVEQAGRKFPATDGTFAQRLRQVIRGVRDENQSAAGRHIVGQEVAA